MTTTKLKHDKVGRYFIAVTSFDTIKRKSLDQTSYNSQLNLVGSFIPLSTHTQFSTNTEIGIQFYENGNCVHTWKVNCSDSHCGSTHRQLGEYKISNDTVYITYYLGKQISHSANQNRTFTLEELPWEVIEPYSKIHLLPRQKILCLTFFLGGLTVYI